MAQKTQITKEDLPVEVQEYIDALEAHVDEQDAAIETMKAEIETTKADFAKAQAALDAAGIDVSDDDGFAKALEKADPGVAAILKAQKAELDAAKVLVAKAEDERATATMIAKAGEVPHLVGEGADAKANLAGILKTAYGVSQEHGDAVFTLLKAANEQVEAADVWGEFGKTGANATLSASLTAAVAAIQKEQPTLSAEEAEVLAYERNPKLYEEQIGA